ncbi:hypothetical protein LXA43DRAFT_1012168 [Ganoderma leucocontextum]|nr:hypothetical protein LXA43DRAFT_1012168 [Ganoderma leucocontextum]
MSSSTTPASTTVASARKGRSYDAYPVHIPREIAPGIMDDGTMSATHPLVQQFVAYTTRKFLEAEARAAVAGPHKDKRWHEAHKHPLVTRWRCLKGGAARVGDVHAALGPGVTDRLAGAIFALGALSVYSFWARPAHWAFWAVNIVEETAAVVHPVMAVNVLRAWHGGFVPRQRKKKQATSDATKEDSDGETKNANGKRRASEDSPPVPSKRKRTKANKDLLPTRRSTRTRKGEQGEPVSGAALDTTPTAPLKTAQPTSHESEEMVVDVESMKTGEDVGTGLEGQAQEPSVARIANKKSRSKPARARRYTGGRKRKGTRKPRVPSGDAPSEQPLRAAPPSSSPCIIRIPARSTPPSASPSPASRELLDRVSAPHVVSTTAAASRESTAVGTPFSGLSTRVGTPQPEFEVKVEPVVVKPKAVREIPAPVRTSARIRAKTLVGASQRR